MVRNNKNERFIPGEYKQEVLGVFCELLQISEPGSGDWYHESPFEEASSIPLDTKKLIFHSIDQLSDEDLSVANLDGWCARIGILVENIRAAMGDHKKEPRSALPALLAPVVEQFFHGLEEARNFAKEVTPVVVRHVMESIAVEEGIKKTASRKPLYEHALYGYSAGNEDPFSEAQTNLAYLSAERAN